MRKCLLIAILSATVFGLVGCDLASWFAYIFAPKIPMKTIEAKFDDLPEKTIAVVIFAGPDIQLDYNMAQLEFTDKVGAELRRKVNDVTIVDVRKIIRYQTENPRWDATPPEKLCEVFGADYVMLISLMELSTREQGSIHMVRGRISAEVNLYKAKQSLGEGENPVWRSGPIYIVHPNESAVGAPVENEETIRNRTEKLFAIELVKNFYAYKVPKES